MPAPAARRKPATYDDLVRVPDHLVAEIVGGKLFATPRPAARHARAASVLGMDLGGPFDRGRGGPGGGSSTSRNCTCTTMSSCPDLAAWHRERLPAIPDIAALTVAPDWICEVVSPSTEALDLGRKPTVYAREGVAHAWLVSPANGILEVFAAIELDLSALWSSS